MTGTSMGKPLVAGYAAVLSQALRVWDPAYKTAGDNVVLLKALLLNGTVPIPDPADRDPSMGRCAASYLSLGRESSTFVFSYCLHFFP